MAHVLARAFITDSRCDTFSAGKVKFLHFSFVIWPLDPDPAILRGGEFYVTLQGLSGPQITSPEFFEEKDIDQRIMWKNSILICAEHPFPESINVYIWHHWVDTHLVDHKTFPIAKSSVHPPIQPSTKRKRENSDTVGKLTTKRCNHGQIPGLASTDGGMGSHKTQDSVVVAPAYARARDDDSIYVSDADTEPLTPPAKTDEGLSLLNILNEKISVKIEGKGDKNGKP